MTSTPSLPAQIEAVREIVSRNGTVKFIWPRDVEIWRAVLVTLQQHERLEAVVKAARDLLRYDAGIKHPGADHVIVSRARVHTLESALAALDAAAPETPTDMSESSEHMLSRKDVAENTGKR